MVYYFLEGGAFMWPILLTLVFGLGFVLERAYSDDVWCKLRQFF